jgi:hypothetical protein
VEQQGKALGRGAGGGPTRAGALPLPVAAAGC